MPRRTKKSVDIPPELLDGTGLEEASEAELDALMDEIDEAEAAEEEAAPPPRRRSRSGSRKRKAPAGITGRMAKVAQGALQLATARRFGPKRGMTQQEAASIVQPIGRLTQRWLLVRVQVESETLQDLAELGLTVVLWAMRVALDTLTHGSAFDAARARGAAAFAASMEEARREAEEGAAMGAMDEGQWREEEAPAEADDFSAYDPVPARTAAPDGMPGEAVPAASNGRYQNVPAGFRAGLTDTIIGRMPGDRGLALQ